MNRLYFRKIKNFIFLGLISLSSLFIIIPLSILLVFLISKGLHGLTWSFITELPKPAGEMGGGIVHALLGTIWILSLASFISIPIGILGGVFLSEYGEGFLANTLRYSADLMTGVPSIVIGIFTYALIVIPMKSFSALAGAIALSLIMLPTIIRSTEEILKLTPKHIRKAALALGVPRWKVIFFIIVKGNISTLFTGIILAISRATGETAPLLFTAFGNMYLSSSWKEPMATLPVQIYNYAISPLENWQNQAWSGALLLIILILILNICARLISGRFDVGHGPKFIFMKLRKKWTSKSF